MVSNSAGRAEPLTDGSPCWCEAVGETDGVSDCAGGLPAEGGSATMYFSWQLTFEMWGKPRVDSRLARYWFAI